MPNIPQFNDKLRWLDYSTLNDLANFFEAHAESCREKAALQVFDDGERNAAAIDCLIISPRIVMRFLRQGCTLSEAQEKTAEDIAAPLELIERSWKRFCYDKSLYELKRRNRLVLELAALGFTNADIGKKVNLHSNSVSRIISKARKDYHSGRAVNDKIKMIINGGLEPALSNPNFA